MDVSAIKNVIVRGDDRPGLSYRAHANEQRSKAPTGKLIRPVSQKSYSEPWSDDQVLAWLESSGFMLGVYPLTSDIGGACTFAHTRLTALSYSAEQGNESVCKWLVDKGANVCEQQ